MDFTIGKYKKLLYALISKGYDFITFKQYIENKENFNNKMILILRHDVDFFPKYALNMALIERKMGIKGSYYFRFNNRIFNDVVIKQIALLGHEIGYHYETMDKVINNELLNNNKNEFSSEEIIDKAYKLFVKELELFREVIDVKTICMHGSPKSKYDNKAIWNRFDYKKLGIVGEPYLDIDWNEFGYLTDTGRRWNGNKINIRDKVKTKYVFDFKKTNDILNNIDVLPTKLMITIHPKRWADNPFLWSKELIWQNIKNVFKFFRAKTIKDRKYF